MNRIFPSQRNTNLAASTKRSADIRAKLLKCEAEAILRDVAYVLALTRRVKSEILQNDEMLETTSA